MGGLGSTELVKTSETPVDMFLDTIKPLLHQEHLLCGVQVCVHILCMCVCVGHNDVQVQVYIRVMCNIGCIGYLATILSLLFRVESKCSGRQRMGRRRGVRRR